MRKIKILFSILFIGAMSNCGGGKESTETQAQLTEEVNQLFPYSETEPLKVFFSCQRLGSNLSYDFDFKGDGNLDVRLVDDLSNEWTLPGTYEFENGQIKLNAINTLTTFPEKSQNTKNFMGMVVAFDTIVDDASADPNQIQMQCIAVGHRYGETNLESWRHYRNCDEQTFNTLRYDNAFEFTAHSSVHTQYAVPGAVFRHRQWLGVQNILQGWGIYRRVDDNYYVYFGNQFDDENLIKGKFINGDQEITVPPLGINCRL